MHGRAAAARAGLADVFPVGAITKGLEGEVLAEIGEMAAAGVRVQRRRPMRPDRPHAPERLTYARAFDDVVIAEHCEDASLSSGQQMHEGFSSSSLGLTGQPGAAEDAIVYRDIELARLTGGRLHICHLSSARSVELVRREGGRAPDLGRGHAASPRVHRRGPSHLRHEQEGRIRRSARRRTSTRSVRDSPTARSMRSPLITHRTRWRRRRPSSTGRLPARSGSRRRSRWPSRSSSRPASSPCRGRWRALVRAGLILGARDHGGPIEAGRPPTSCCSIPRSAGPSSRRSSPDRGTAPSSVGSSADGSAARCSMGSSRSRRGRPRGDGARSAPGPRGRHRLPGIGIRRGGRVVRRSGLQHRDGRLSGGPHGSVLRRPDVRR